MTNGEKQQPNILFIMSDDHAAHALSCYDSQINETPNLDRIANDGMTFADCYCTNSICAPSRASILTGKYNHLNGVQTLGDTFDGRQQTAPKILQENGYETAIIGKWHLGHGGISDPTGFDYWNVLPGQGDYFNPAMIEMGVEKVYEGYVTDIITDMSIDWLENRDKTQPFMLMCHHKAPHRPWLPDEAHAHLYKDTDIPVPKTFNDDYANRSRAAEMAKMRIEDDLNEYDLKEDPPAGLTRTELKNWKYQRYIKDYLRCIASIDDNVGRLLDYLDEAGMKENTLVIYTSDQGFFLGDHGWYDKRFMYDESLRMPFVVRYPELVKPGTKTDALTLNVDFAPTFLELAGIPVSEDMQGVSLVPILKEECPDDWRRSMYYRYWEHMSKPHKVCAHYGVRTERYKLIYYYNEALGNKRAIEMPLEPEWELFDLENDPMEMQNRYDDPAYEDVVKDMKDELYRLKTELKDVD